ncbi:hypothetical protein HDU67_003831 [Dinochytrium kinnereticum]|nr:hypothetical protein HDU67_003831 [Dinochytrium kinnereticum]
MTSRAFTTIDAVKITDLLASHGHSLIARQSDCSPPPGHACCPGGVLACPKGFACKSGGICQKQMNLSPVIIAVIVVAILLIIGSIVACIIWSQRKRRAAKNTAALSAPSTFVVSAAPVGGQQLNHQ